MDKSNFLVQLFVGRKVNKSLFDSYFYLNGSFGTSYIAEVNEKDDYVPITIHVEVIDDSLSWVEVLKTEESGGHGRPVVHELRISAPEYKTIFQILEESFPYMYEDEVASTIDQALRNHASYEGYTISKISKTKVTFVDLEGTFQNIDIKTYKQLLECLHHDLYMQKSPTVFAEKCAYVCKKSWQPLYAILQFAQPETYPNFAQLNLAYRTSELEKAIQCADLDKCESYKDVISMVSNAASFIEIAVEKKQKLVLEWLLLNVELKNLDLSKALYWAIYGDDEEVFKLILETGAYDAEKSESSRWYSPMQQAIEQGDQYIVALLKHGFILNATSSLYNKWTLDTIKERAQYLVLYDLDTLSRIIKADRQDIIDVLCKNGLSQDILCRAYIENERYDDFCNTLHEGAKISSPRDFLKAYENGTKWADRIFETDFDINMDEGRLLAGAAEELNDSLFTYLLRKGADPYIRGQYSQTIFEKAAGFHGYLDDDEQRRKTNICVALLDYGVNPISESRNTPTIINYLLGSESSDELRHITVQWLYNKNLLNTIDFPEEGHIPIFYIFGGRYSAAYSLELLQQFLSCEAVVDASGISDDLLFIEACKTCDVEGLKLLINHGANIHEKWRDLNALWYAAQAGRPIEVIKLLVEIGMEVNTYRPEAYRQGYFGKTNRIEGSSVLDEAMHANNQEVVGYLVSIGAKTYEDIMQHNRSEGAADSNV